MKINQFQPKSFIHLNYLFMKSLLFLCCLIWINFLNAQSNDQCNQAIIITNLDGSFSNYDFSGATFDLVNGSCASSSSNNVWFKFKAKGPNAILTIPNNPNLVITIMSLPNPCSILGATELDCGPNQLVVNNLIVDSLYFVQVSDDTFGPFAFDLSIFNAVTPTNDAPCEAIVIPTDGCVSGTTVGAQQNFAVPNCDPSDTKNSIFYRYQMGAENAKLELNFNSINITGNMSVTLMIFPNGCNETPTLAGPTSYYCGIPINHLSFDIAVPGSLIYIMVGSSTLGAGNFTNMCLTESAGGEPCASNISCQNAENINIGFGETACITGCNNGMPDGGFVNCNNDFQNPTAWYKFNSGTSNTATFSLTSNELSDLSYVILTDCNTILECNPQIVTLLPNTNYFIAITDGSGAVGSFDFCVTLLSIIAPCIKDELFTITGASMGSPLDGPFQPCEVITFQYSTNFFAGGGCQWIHSFIPYISECWSNQIPKLIVYPNETNASNFNWYPPNSIYWKPTNNNPPSSIGINQNGQLCLIGTSGCLPFEGGDGNCGSTLGTGMPGGWVCTNASGSCGGSANPNQSWGIQQGCSSTVLKSLRFEMIVPCDACASCANDPEGLVIGIASFTDGATGGFSLPTCNGNYLFKKKISVECCMSAFISVAKDTICSSQTLITDFGISDSSATLEWVILNTQGLTGASSGSGEFFTQTLTNHSDIIRYASYNVRSVNSAFCKGEYELFTIAVLPQIKTDLLDQVLLCNQSSIAINPVIAGGIGQPYNYIWSDGSSADTINVFTLNDTVIYLSVTDARGCTAIDSISIKISLIQPIELPANQLIQGNLIFNGSEIQTFSVDSFPNASNYYWTFEGEIIGDNLTLTHSFDTFPPGNYELCVHAYNCLLDTLALCFTIKIITGNSNADCIGADTICKKDRQTFTFENSEGNFQEWNTDPSCDFNTKETNVHWLTFDIVKAGKLWFTIYPNSNQSDLDFILYKSAESCEAKEAIRCSFAGTDGLCLGNTGLSPDEIDVSEAPNCDQGQNNFLKALDCEVGDRYFLAINDFSTAEHSFDIEFCGDALMSCDTVVCQTLASNKNSKLMTFNIYPNPGNGDFTIDLKDQTLQTIEVYNAQGMLMLIEQNLNFEKVKQLNLNFLPSGIYHLIIRNAQGSMIGRSKLGLINN